MPAFLLKTYENLLVRVASSWLSKSQDTLLVILILEVVLGGLQAMEFLNQVFTEFLSQNPSFWLSGCLYCLFVWSAG